MTGCGDIPGSATSKTCNEYTSEKGLLASTTGNITGIYDMSGGAYEYVAGYRDGINGVNQNYPLKYFDVYHTQSSDTTYQYRILGDATGEMGPFANNTGSWYGDSSYFINKSVSWFLRGGSYSGDQLAGIFQFDRYNGTGYSTYSTRLVLAP